MRQGWIVFLVALALAAAALDWLMVVPRWASVAVIVAALGVIVGLRVWSPNGATVNSQGREPLVDDDQE